MRNLILFGKDGWSQSMKSWSGSVLLENLQAPLLFESPDRLAEFLAETKDETLILTAASLAHSEALLQACQNPRQNIALLCGANLSMVISARILLYQRDTLAELAQSLLAEARQDISSTLF